VIGQWLRWRDWHRPALGLWFWHDRSGNEVDLVIERDQRLFAVECKLSEHPDQRDIRGIEKLRQFYGPENVVAASVACTTGAPFEIASGVVAREGWRVWEGVPAITS
jgi:hypothetical protein